MNKKSNDDLHMHQSPEEKRMIQGRESKSRRANGEGSIHKRTDGRWAASYELGWKDGKRVRKTVYGTTQKEVADKLRSVRRQIEQGLVLPPERFTVADFLTEWLEAVEPSLRPRTFQRYREVVNAHLIPGLGKHKLAQLGPQHVERFLAIKASEPRVRQANMKRSTARPLAPRTVQEIRTVLVVALNKGLRWGRVSRNVAALVGGPRIPHHEIKPLTPAQARVMLDAASGHRMEALYSVAVAIGLRQGEALALTWDDVEFDSGMLHVRRSLQSIAGEYRLVETKTASSRRSIALPDLTVAALREHRVRQIEERLAAGSRWDGSWNLVFCTPVGRPLHGPSVTRQFQQMIERAGLPRQRFHDLRHACASLLLAQGTEMKVIQELLGHSTMTVTANVYSHLTNDMKRDAASKMDAIFTTGDGANREGRERRS